MELLPGEKGLSVSNHGFCCYPFNFIWCYSFERNQTSEAKFWAMILPQNLLVSSSEESWWTWFSFCFWQFHKVMYQTQVFGPTGIPSEHLKVTEGGRRQEERLPLCLLTGCPLLSQILSCPVWQLPTHLVCGQFLGIAGGQGFHGPEVPRDMGAAMGVATPLLRARRLLDIFFFFQFF